MIGKDLWRGALSVAMLAVATCGAAAGNRLPVQDVSMSRAFDAACANYYEQGNDQEVEPGIAVAFCTCLAGELESQGEDAMDFYARTYSEDLTTFIQDYPKGDAWMNASFAADKQCKENTDYGSNEPAPAEGAADVPNLPMEAASWGGVVRSGPGKAYRKLASLDEGEHIMLVENTGVVTDGYPWWKIEYGGRHDGYQWGGIICGLKGTPIDGAFETCTEP